MNDPQKYAVALLDAIQRDRTQPTRLRLDAARLLLGLPEAGGSGGVVPIIFLPANARELDAPGTSTIVDDF